MIDLPIKEIGSAVEAVIGGDLTVKLNSDSRDEIGTLENQFSDMIQAIIKSNSKEAVKMARTAALVDNSPSNIMMVDNDLNLIYMNPASINLLRKLEHLLPCTVDSMMGKCIDLFLNDPGRVRKILADPGNLPYFGNIDLGGEKLTLTASAIYGPDKARIGTMASWELVTAKRNLEISLQESAATVANSAGELASSGQEMSVTVNEISENLQKANETTSKAVSMTEAMNEKIRQLEGASNEIGSVMKVISNIAAQTNLLALNATIEAARAGEAGKGFAVVASEVKDLAKGTAKATQDIQGLISAIQENTKEAVSTIDEITGIIRENDEITTSIAGAVEEQSATANEISDNMARTSKGTDKIVESIKEVLAL
ncbi:MAG: methyl-accepting chemotaxis protein [Nitrospiria bacterium]